MRDLHETQVLLAIYHSPQGYLDPGGPVLGPDGHKMSAGDHVLTGLTYVEALNRLSLGGYVSKDSRGFWLLNRKGAETAQRIMGGVAEKG